jgi:hypothetical protein
MNLPYLPDEIVSLIFDFIRPKLGFEFKNGQIFKCDGFDVEITSVKIRPYYNEILIAGDRCLPNERCGFQTNITLTNKYKDMCIDKTNWISFELNKNMLKE